MKLEMRHYDVRDVRFGNETVYSNATLTIDKEALLNLISDDPRLRQIDLQIAKPGEETRIVNIVELSEPRVKLEEGDCYPGLFGSLRKAGETGFMPGFPGNVRRHDQCPEGGRHSRAGLLKEILRAEGVIITKEGGGHTDVDIMKNCEECEKLGIKTVLIDNEWLGPDGMNELPLICISPAANAMVSVGNFEEMLDLPAMKKVIGGDRMPEVPGSPKEKLTISISLVPKAISQLGFTYLRTEES